MKNTDTIIKLLLTLGFLILTCSVAYYFIIFLPQKELLKIENEKNLQISQQQQLVENQKLLQLCLDDVSDRFSKMDTKNVSNDSAKIIIDLLQSQKEECFKKFPNK